MAAPAWYLSDPSCGYWDIKSLTRSNPSGRSTTPPGAGTVASDCTPIAVAHSEPSGDGRRVVLDRLLLFQGSKGRPVRDAEVEAAMLALWRACGRPKVRIDPFGASEVVQNLRGRGVSVDEWRYTHGRYGAMASVLFGLLRDGRVSLYDAPGFADQLANVRLIETLPGQVRIQHDPGRHDDRCVALGMAIVPLAEQHHGHSTARSASGYRLPKSPTSTWAVGATSRGGGMPSFIRKSHRGMVILPGAYKPPDPNR